MRVKVVVLSVVALLSIALPVFSAQEADDAETEEVSEKTETPVQETSDEGESQEPEEDAPKVTDASANNATAPSTSAAAQSATNVTKESVNGQSQEKPAEQEQKPEEAKPELPASPQIVSVPEKKPEPTPISDEPQLGESDSINIDTLNLEEPRGNWLLKRQWWEESERLYEKIQAISVRIDDLKMAFYQQRSTLDREVFPRFYQNIGIGQGQLSQLLTTLSSEVLDTHILANKEKEDELERPLVNRLKAEKENFERLQKLVKSVETYDIAMQEALMKLRDQVKIARRYEVEAWNTFKSIARELSDRKAYEQYYAVKGYLGSIKDIETYLKGPFGDYFNMLDGKVKQEIAQVQKLMADLQKRGIDLKNDSQSLEQMLRKQKESEGAAEEEDAIDSQESSLLSYVSWPFIAIWNGITSLVSSARSLFSNLSQTDDSQATGSDE